MAAPNYQAAGAIANVSAGTITPAWPTHAIGDIAFCLCSQWQGSDPGAATTASTGWTSIGTQLSQNGLTFQQITLFWCRATSASMPAPSITAPGTSGASAQIFTVRNALATGTPYDVTSSGASNASTTAISVPGATTTTANTLVLFLTAAANASTVSGETNASLAGFTEQSDSSGTFNSISATSGTLAAASTYNTTTATLSAAAVNGGWTVAVKPLVPAGTASPSQPFGPPWRNPGQFQTTRWNGPREVVSQPVTLTITIDPEAVVQSNPTPGARITPFAPPWVRPGQFARTRWNGPREVVAPPITITITIDPELPSGVDTPTLPGAQYSRRREPPWQMPGQFARTRWNGPREVVAPPIALTITIDPEARGYNPARLKAGWWGPWFPKRGRRSWWDGWFPEAKGSLVLASIPSLPVVDPSTAAGAATIALVVESGLKVKYSWDTDVIKSQHGNETRISKLTRPKERYTGTALVVGDDVRTLRATLARFAPLGSAFLLGLAHEGATLTAASSGLVVTVGSTQYLDWAIPGVRCVCVGSDRTQRVECVVQAVSSTTITLDVAPGTAGTAGGMIMPAVPVYLDPQATFDRYTLPEPVETWQIGARAAQFGYPGSGVRAALSCAQPKTTGTALQALTYVSRLTGLAQNQITVTQTAGGSLSVTENVGAKTVVVTFVASTTTADQFVSIINAQSTLVAIDGTWTPSTVLLASLDEFTTTALVGGRDAAVAAVGLGSNVTYYQGKPLYDRGLISTGTNSDSIQTLVQIVDLGGLPLVTTDSDQADWGRHMAIRGSKAADFQWLKYFLSLVGGRQHAFWLPTYRGDLVVVSNTSTTITIASANFLSWYQSPFFRTQVAVIQTDNTLTPAQITTVVDNGNSTFTLTIPITSTLSGVPIKALSWLELVRLESDDVEVSFDGATFAADLQARVVQL